MPEKAAIKSMKILAIILMRFLRSLAKRAWHGQAARPSAAGNISNGAAHIGEIYEIRRRVKPCRVPNAPSPGFNIKCRVSKTPDPKHCDCLMPYMLVGEKRLPSIIDGRAWRSRDHYNDNR